MRAVVIEAPNEASLHDLDEPGGAPGDVVVRSEMAGVCRTDIEIYRGQIAPHRVRYPCIPGHEWTGVVEEAGSDDSDLRAGDRVVCEGMVYCGACANCSVGATNLCLNYDQLGYTRPGGYAELVVVPRRVVHRLDETISPEAAVLIEPAACVVRAFERLAPERGARIAVVGVGTLGAIALRVAQTYQPTSLVALGLRDDELELARKLGATDAARPDEAEGLGTDAPQIVLEAAGDPRAVITALDIAAPGGRVGVLGLAGKDAELQIEQDVFVRKDLTMIGSVSYTSSAWRQTMALVASGRLRLDDLVSQRFPLERFEEAFALLEDPQAHNIKVVLEHG